MRSMTAAFALGLVLLFAHGEPANAQGGQAPTLASAKPGDVRVLCTTAFHWPADLIAQAEKAIGKKIVVEYGGVRGALKDRILKGLEFEVGILLPDVNAELFKAGKILPETHEIGRNPTAFAVRGDAPGIDLSTPEAVKAALLKAKSVKYSAPGFARDTARKVLSTLQIADKIKDSSTLGEEVALGPGEYEIRMFPISELIERAEPGIRIVGLVMPSLQVPAVMQAVISQQANDVNAARALIEFLQGPAIDPALRAFAITKSVVDGTLK